MHVRYVIGYFKSLVGFVLGGDKSLGLAVIQDVRDLVFSETT